MDKEDVREHYRHVAILRLLLASSYLAFRGSSSADMRSLLIDILDTTNAIQAYESLQREPISQFLIRMPFLRHYLPANIDIYN